MKREIEDKTELEVFRKPELVNETFFRYKNQDGGIEWQKQKQKR